MIKTPASLVSAMTKYQDGITKIPQGFLILHDIYAEVDMKEKQTEGTFVLLEDQGLVHDGHADTMKVRQIVVAQKTESWKIHTLKWHTSGAWFSKGAGWTRHLELSDNTKQKADQIVKNYDWTS